MNVQESWKRIADWYRTQLPEKEFRLAPGASEEQIAALEKVLGVRLPDDVRQYYLLHDGTDETFLVHWGDVLSLKGIESEWSTYANWQQDEEWGSGDEWVPDFIGHGYGASYEPRTPEADAPQVTGEPIKAIWWNPLRIPITSGADNLFLDLDPGEGGTSGQVINYSHEIGPLRVLAPSFSEWLEGIADALEAGKLVYDEDAETVCPPGMYG